MKTVFAIRFHDGRWVECIDYFQNEILFTGDFRFAEKFDDERKALDFLEELFEEEIGARHWKAFEIVKLFVD